MPRKLKLPHFKLTFGAYNVGRKIIRFDGLQYYFPSVFLNYKFEVELFSLKITLFLYSAGSFLKDCAFITEKNKCDFGQWYRTHLLLNSFI